MFATFGYILLCALASLPDVLFLYSATCIILNLSESHAPIASASNAAIGKLLLYVNANTVSMRQTSYEVPMNLDGIYYLAQKTMIIDCIIINHFYVIYIVPPLCRS